MKIHHKNRKSTNVPEWEMMLTIPDDARLNSAMPPEVIT